MSKMRRILSGGDKGFTLIELLVVIAVLGILAAIAIPRLTGVTDQAVVAQIESDLRNIKTGMEVYYVDNDRDYSSITTIGGLSDYITLNTDISYSFDTTVNDYVVSTTTAQGSDTDIEGYATPSEINVGKNIGAIPTAN